MTSLNTQLQSALIGKNKTNIMQMLVFKVDGLEISEYFTNIGLNQAKRIQCSPVSHKNFLDGSFPNSIFLNPVDESKIIQIAKHLTLVKLLVMTEF
jgi:hypothetical protein